MDVLMHIQQKHQDQKINERIKQKRRISPGTHTVGISVYVVEELK